VKFGGTLHVEHTKIAVPLRALIPDKCFSITSAPSFYNHVSVKLFSDERNHSKSFRLNLTPVALLVLSRSPASAAFVYWAEKFRLDELIRRDLAAWKDPREVVANPHARYYRIEVKERTLVPEADARLSQTRFETWLTQPAAKAAAASQ
jgi:hypothetical protein